ncbi:transcriptional regulator [Levilactobacillus yonginensis]|uniref:transcriptional regulator n=1 Tax=Levilactobacillus yonginensis TaxID=1054041 RepID=UPI00345DFCFD
MKSKIIGKSSFPGIDGKYIKYNVLELTEIVTVFTESFKNTHCYWVEEGEDINNEENYMEPMDDPDFNLKLDYKMYREKFNFLNPNEIKHNREKLGLTLREVSTVLAMSYATLSNIENGLILQSYSQELKLRQMDNVTRFCDLAETHKSLIAQRKSVDVEKLFRKLRKDKNEEIASFDDEVSTLAVDSSYTDENSSEDSNDLIINIFNNSFSEGGGNSWKKHVVRSSI